jgi:hypothetical protein
MIPNKFIGIFVHEIVINNAAQQQLEATPPTDDFTPQSISIDIGPGQFGIDIIGQYVPEDRSFDLTDPSSWVAGQLEISYAERYDSSSGSLKAVPDGPITGTLGPATWAPISETLNKVSIGGPGGVPDIAQSVLDSLPASVPINDNVVVTIEYTDAAFEFLFGVYFAAPKLGTRPRRPAVTISWALASKVDVKNGVPVIRIPIGPWPPLSWESNWFFASTFTAELVDWIKPDVRWHVLDVTLNAYVFEWWPPADTPGAACRVIWPHPDPSDYAKIPVYTDFELPYEIMVSVEEVQSDGSVIFDVAVFRVLMAFYKVPGDPGYPPQFDGSWWPSPFLP